MNHGLLVKQLELHKKSKTTSSKTFFGEHILKNAPQLLSHFILSHILLKLIHKTTKNLKTMS